MAQEDGGELWIFVTILVAVVKGVLFFWLIRRICRQRRERRELPETVATEQVEGRQRRPQFSPPLLTPSAPVFSSNSSSISSLPASPQTGEWEFRREISGRELPANFPRPEGRASLGESRRFRSGSFPGWRWLSPTSSAAPTGLHSPNVGVFPTSVEDEDLPPSYEEVIEGRTAPQTAPEFSVYVIHK